MSFTQHSKTAPPNSEGTDMASWKENSLIARQLLRRLVKHENLTQEDMKTFGKIVVGFHGNSVLESSVGRAISYQIPAILAFLKAKGETCDELLGLRSALIPHSIPLSHGIQGVTDIVGTGGSGFNTVNISTGAAILAAACGVPIAKHGSARYSSLCGSSDVLTELGISVAADSSTVLKSLQNSGITFCLAVNFHPAMSSVKEIRQALGIRTIFNLLGPLMNPAAVQHLLLGVTDPSYLPIYASAIKSMSIGKSLVLHCEGLDELSPTGVSQITQVNVDGTIENFSVVPEEVGLETFPLEDLQGGEPKDNAKLLIKAFERSPALPGVDSRAIRAIRSALAFNAGAAIWASGRASTLKQGVQMAMQTCKDGKALEKLNEWRLCMPKA
eukprot:GHVT01047665.1.p1 GENE.GHVT01047665.1~~GHVT01047665.1.p1  ORF type:complete len:386 (+),score=43.96 GHVT01047665.1:1557-2714(+)